jgi:transcriptional regulator with XRE-family HTH domain
LTIELLTPAELAGRVADRARARRLELGLTQQAVADRSGVSLGSLRRFERTGRIAFDSLLRIALALDALAAFEGLFPAAEFRSIDDVIAKPRRQRAPRS